MLNRFLQELHRLVGADVRQKYYLVAVSGGADSIVTATLFHEAGLRFAVAHCNFHLRGADSNRDMHFVEETTALWNVPLYLQEFNTLDKQKNSGKSVEMVARELRYNWFNELLPHFDFLVTAHQSNDAAETMLLNLTRGTGLRGLCGIPAINGKIIRPMLIFTANEIRRYAKNHHVAYVNDYTNRDEEIARNRVRHSVIPQLEKINPKFLETNAHNRLVFQRQYAYYQKHIEAAKQRILQLKGNRFQINRTELEKYEDKELVLYEILNEFGFPTEVSDKLAESTNIQAGKQFFSDDYKLLIDRGFFVIQPKQDSEESDIHINSIEELGFYFDIEEFDYQPNMEFDKNPDILYVPKEKLTFPLQIRSWQSGDYFYPLGAKGRQKLSDFFTDHKIDRFSKEQIRLLCADNQIIWIIGWRSDDRYKVQKKDSKCYKISTVLTPNNQ